MSSQSRDEATSAFLTLQSLLSLSNPCTHLRNSESTEASNSERRSDYSAAANNLSRSLRRLDGVYDDRRVVVTRSNFDRSCLNALVKLKAKDFRKRWFVHFSGEEGIDCGGVSREFMEMSLRLLFSSYCWMPPTNEEGENNNVFETYGDEVTDGTGAGQNGTSSGPSFYCRVLPDCSEPLFMVPVDEKVTVLQINPRATGRKELELLRVCGRLCARIIIESLHRTSPCPLPQRVARSLFSKVVFTDRRKKTNTTASRLLQTIFSFL